MALEPWSPLLEETAPKRPAESGSEPPSKMRRVAEELEENEVGGALSLTLLNGRLGYEKRLELFFNGFVYIEESMILLEAFGIVMI